MIVLWELSVVIPFPPGSTVMFISGHVTHFNLPIPEGETRWSFTQYMAQALMTIVANRGQRYEDLEPDDQKAAKKAAANRPITELRLYSTLDSLMDDRLHLLQHMK
jgi:hypothetical protein